MLSCACHIFALALDAPGVTFVDTPGLLRATRLDFGVSGF